MADVRARKFKPIYEAIDVHNYRGALKLCAKRDLEALPLTKVRRWRHCVAVALFVPRVCAFAFHMCDRSVHVWFVSYVLSARVFGGLQDLFVKNWV